MGWQGLERHFPEPRLPLGHASPRHILAGSKWSQSHGVCSPWESAVKKLRGLQPRLEAWVVKQGQEPRGRGAGRGLGWERQGMRGSADVWSRRPPRYRPA